MNRRAAAVVGCLPALAAASLTVACQPSSAVVSTGAVKSTPDAGAEREGSEEESVAIYVTSNGWHTGIVVARATLRPGAVPEIEDFPVAPYLEFGWGDAEYYPAPRPTLGMALGAALGQNPAIVHLIGLPAHPREVYPNSEVVELGLSPDGFQRLIRYLDATFARDGAERIPASAPGLYS
ncbi:MAG: DUF2459 domain-containing protein, partial [Pseudomonadota bacterium]